MAKYEYRLTWHGGNDCDPPEGKGWKPLYMSSGSVSGEVTAGVCYATASDGMEALAVVMWRRRVPIRPALPSVMSLLVDPLVQVGLWAADYLYTPLPRSKLLDATVVRVRGAVESLFVRAWGSPAGDANPGSVAALLLVVAQNPTEYRWTELLPADFVSDLCLRLRDAASDVGGTP